MPTAVAPASAAPRHAAAVIGLGTWAIDGVQEMSDPAEAVDRALALAPG
jgi:hypothetical protein